MASPLSTIHLAITPPALALSTPTKVSTVPSASLASMATTLIPFSRAALTAGRTPLTSIATTISPVTPCDTNASISLFCLAESLLALAMLKVQPAALAASVAPSFIWVKKAAVWLIWVMPMLHLPAPDEAASLLLAAGVLAVLPQAASVMPARTSTTKPRLDHRLFCCMLTPLDLVCGSVKVFPHAAVAWVTMRLMSNALDQRDR